MEWTLLLPRNPSLLSEEDKNVRARTFYQETRGGSIQLDIKNSVEYSIDFYIE